VKSKSADHNNFSKSGHFRLINRRMTVTIWNALTSLNTMSICVVVLVSICAIPTILWSTLYFASNLYMYFAGPVNLKKKYKAEWALVTGAGTGIGKSISETVAAQGLNVVLVSLPDKVIFILHFINENIHF
jgi:3-oxoacyl-ACP reductase-like protein